jgi:SAM-dependent methyltransferase
MRAGARPFWSRERHVSVSHVLRQRVKSFLGPRWTTRLRCLSRGRGVPRWGNLRRVTPFSSNFGFDRGTPVDRYYLHHFLEKNRAHVTGEVLEIQAPVYATQFGSNLRIVHSVDINPESQPTYVCDLAQSEGIIPSDRYDCFLLPNTLCVLRDIEDCLRQALRVIKPGGVILASTAGFVPLTPDYPDYWHLSAAGWEEIAHRAWPGCEVTVGSHGNCLAAVAAMLGLAFEELTPSELDVRDPRYPVLITVFCHKPGSVSKG